MSGTRRLSLHARMLVLLIGVTTMFLVIMGTVSTVILARNVTRQVKGDLVEESTFSPAEVSSPERLLGGPGHQGGRRRAADERGRDHDGDHGPAGRGGPADRAARAAGLATHAV